MKTRCALISLFSISLLSGCAKPPQNLAYVDTTNLTQLENVQVAYATRTSSRRSELSNMRSKSLQDSAMSIGAQGGLSWASKQINVRMNEDKKYLDTIYNFNAMVLSHGVIPPILEEGDFTLNIDDPMTIRVADRTYKIVKQARFATTAPNWREYLWMSFDKPTLPHRALLPKNECEARVWRKAIRLGWQKGIEQAYAIFHQNLAILKRDYQGMILYRKLLQEKMISQPFVARTELGVTGNGSDMRINDQVLRIVELPKLQTNAKRWNAIVVKK